MKENQIKKYKLKKPVENYLKSLIPCAIGAFGITYIQNTFYDYDSSYLIPAITTLVVSLIVSQFKK